MELKDFDSVDDYLAHYGILGMKWGVRRQRGRDGTVKSGLSSKVNKLLGKNDEPKTREPVKVKVAPGQRVKAQGGRNAPPSEDAKRAAAYRQTARASTVDSLSNKQLEALIKRMNLERSYAQLNPPTGGKAFIARFLRQNGKELVPITYQVAVSQNPKLANNKKVKVAAQLATMALGGNAKKKK